METKALIRLYLAQGDKNVYVDTSSLPQHQYDGIRFLYKQFKKNKPGVILNDPAGYGKRVQTVIFLSAMRPVITAPTLILCNERIEDLWMRRFHQWTNMASEVLVQIGNEYTKSACVIGSPSQVNILSRREWGVVVVDDTVVPKEVLRAGFNAKYKIWLTSIDLKKHLQTFSLLYKWLNPKDKFNTESFQSDNKNPTALLSHSVRLDAFMEDIVIRRRDVAVPLGNATDTPYRQQVTRKNKDATGKKIKRSKPLPSSHGTSAETHNTTAESHNASGESHNTSTGSHDTSAGSDDAHFEQNKSLLANGYVVDKKETEEFIVKIEGDITKTNEEEPPRLILNCSNKVTNTSKIESEVNENHVMECDISRNEYEFLLNDDTPDSQSICITYDSESQEDELENIPAKKAKITNEVNEDFTQNK